MSDETLNSARTITSAIYALQALSFFFGITCLIAIIINYVKRDDVRGTWLESHFRWQMRTFWFGILWGIIGGLLCFVMVGFVILGIEFIWLLYRIIKGWLNLVDGKEMYA